MFSPLTAKSDAAPAPDGLDAAAVAYLTLPLALFLLGWFQWWAALPLGACVVYGLRPLAGVLRHGTRLPTTRLQLMAAVVAGCGWALLGGADHILFANTDWHIRDAVLHDLVYSPWPVGYGPLDGAATMLRAPVAFYLPAALTGKMLGLDAAHIAMGVWTAAGATLFLLQVMSLVPSRVGTTLLVIAVVVLFSGLDIVGALLNDGPRFRAQWNVTTHLEWWAGRYQYSSMSTQLFWVPNHALGGWLSIGLLCRHHRSPALNRLLPIVVVAAALWSPLAAIGLVPFVLLRVASDSLHARSLEHLDPRVWAPAALVGWVVCAYLVLDPGRIQKGVAVNGADGQTLMDLLQQWQFFVLEAGCIGAAILWIRRSTELTLALMILALLPFVYLGPANDLVMRASIPSLAMLCIGACLALVDQGSGVGRKQWVLGGVLLVGAVTPLEEIARALLLPVWPINREATLIGADCGRFAPHYVARRGQEFIGELLRPLQPLTPVPQGLAACRNPALEIMWSRTFPERRDLRALSPIDHPGGRQPSPGHP